MKSKSFRTRAALILTTLMLLAAAGTVATAQTYTDLYNFCVQANCTDGSNPSGVLAQGRDGNLYGTTYSGGTNHLGVVFRITPSGTLRVLYKFDGVHGSWPESGLTLGTDGNFYGTSSFGGANNYGTIFKITKSGTLTTLYSFTGNANGDGASPWASPVQGMNGNFYGGTFGGFTAYEITSSGNLTQFAYLSGQVSAPLVLGEDGNFYGTTLDGGTAGYGTVFKMTPKGIVTVIYDFDVTHGEYPWASVIQGSDGNFYGTTQQGGAYSWGVVFKLTTQGTLTVLHNFPDPNYPNDGSVLYAGLVQATDGNFYGVTQRGGTTGEGVTFRITPGGDYSILDGANGENGGISVATPMQHTNGMIYGLAWAGGTPGAGFVYSLDMGLAPFVRLVSTLGKVGKRIEILGQGFTGTTAVSFNGTPATYTIASDTLLGATVPAGATTGFVTVTTPSGTLTSNQQFTIKP